MKTIIIKVCLVMGILLTCIFCKAQPNKNNNSIYLITRLEVAEKQKDIKKIKNLFLNEAIILLPDAPPIAGNKAICGLYGFGWAKNRNEFSEYLVDSVAKYESEIFEYGQIVTWKENKQKEILPFYVKFKKSQNDWVISELNFGNTSYEEKMPQLPKPTGEYNIGQVTYFYQKNQTSTSRYLSFQVWFPTQQQSGEKYKYRSPQAAEAAAKFLGWPIFGNSFVTLIETNSYRNADVVPNKTFPVLIYNHGYGGFSGVYQTVFEELASHGYIVVSIGHQDESALLQVDDKIVIPNSRENEFYSKRSSELNGREINELQFVILNSDDDNKVKMAYQKLLGKSPLHRKSVELWASDTKETIKKLISLNMNSLQLSGSFDFDNIGVFGHSVGGATAGELAFSCPQVKAAINLDGFQFGNLFYNKLQVPFLFVSSNSSGSNYLRISPFKEASVHPCHQIIIKGFSHDMFSDLPLVMNHNERAVLMQCDIILKFFDKYIKHKYVDLKDIESKYGELKFNN